MGGRAVGGGRWEEVNSMISCESGAGGSVFVSREHDELMDET